MFGKFLIFAPLLLTATARTYAAIPSAEEALREFARDPRAYMTSPPAKEVVGDSRAAITEREDGGDALVRAKFALRARRFPGIAARAAIGANDRPQDLVDRFKYSTLESMANAGLTSAALAAAPWSGDYWPTYTGLTAKRYADSGFPFSKDWKTNSNYLLNTLPPSVDARSPAEKYDLLAGDGSSTLKHEQIDEGEPYYEQSGAVATWMGICHGWSPAAYMVARPTQAVTVTAANGGTRIEFYPDDIKALASVLWANGDFTERYIGGRCENTHPATDSVGRVQDPDCFDTNPGTWHQSVVNQIGVARRPFIMDASFDFQVWNQPVLSYAYSYFNPSSMNTAGSLEAARVSRAGFTNDKFRSYRSASAASFVGVVMNVVYVAENTPAAVTADGVSRDKRIRVQYLYDLELDANGNIIGGEWYKNQHPDFLWTPLAGQQARAPGDIALDSQGEHAAWNGSTPIPAAWESQVPGSSSRGAPLARIVNALVRMANGS